MLRYLCKTVSLDFDVTTSVATYKVGVVVVNSMCDGSGLKMSACVTPIDAVCGGDSY